MPPLSSVSVCSGNRPAADLGRNATHFVLGQAQFLCDPALRLPPEEGADGDLAVGRGKLVPKVGEMCGDRLIEPPIHRMHPPD